MELKEGVTPRGFKFYKFTDLDGSECSIQESSLADDEAIWMGIGDLRMHLNKEQVKMILPVLKDFTEKGLL